MLKKFKQHLHQNFPFLEEGKLLIAVSGGIDSVVLGHLCSQLNLNFSLCHCNFNLRGQESNDDEVYVKDLAKNLQVPVYTSSFETEKYATKNKVSIQVAARDLRYAWFYELLEKKHYEYVLTAHNTNDNLETFIINLTRGTGLEGFTGIPPINNKAVRPLLAFSRDDITLFAIKNEIVYIIEANPRASRTVPFIAKAYKQPYVNYATKVMLGELKVSDIDYKPNLKGFAIKQPVFSFNKFPNVNKSLGHEMKSTGESILFIDDLKDDQFYELYSRRKMYLTK